MKTKTHWETQRQTIKQANTDRDRQNQTGAD